MRFAHLVCVTSVNNNKYYDMRETPSGIEVTYGRIGATANYASYPASKWDSIYRQKLRKGYEDMTNMLNAANTPVQIMDQFKPIADQDVAGLIDYLRSKARDTIQRNYTVSSDRVTRTMVDTAQGILDQLSVNPNMTVQLFNDRLMELFKVIPRRMDQVIHYLAAEPGDYKKIIDREQKLLDVMAGQISTPIVVPSKDGDPEKTILEAYGLEFSPVTDKDVAIIKKELGKECAHLYYKAWRVENLETRQKFKDFVKGKGRIAKKLYWHGSVTENWWSILRTGLKLRPTNAAINGKMYGFGLYFAPRALKSLGYTSLRGSCWAGGTSRFGFMALYDVVYGKPFNVDDCTYGDMTYEKLQRIAPGCTCLHAHAGKLLHNDEIIVYKEEQTTIKYLVELRTS